MTESTRTIFEKYEVRKSKKQKAAFIDWVSNETKACGYDVSVEKGLFGARNVVIGNPEKAQVLFGAHYDTCSSLLFPNFITPRCFPIYLLYQLGLALGIYVGAFCLAIVLALFGVPYALEIGEGIALVAFGSMLFGPANKHAANDNTSGVTTVLDLMNRVPEEQRDSVAFVLFDLEEAGLWGSLSFRLKHRKTMRDKLLVNFDCVSDGDNILVITKKKANKYDEILKKAFESNNGFNVSIVSRGVFYPSDQYWFPFGVGVGAFRRSRLLKMLYLNRIHTKRDTVYREENIAFLVDCGLRLISKTVR